jgi:disulfide bond formation protein DsbB
MLAFAASAAMLGAAHAFETFGGYEPCALCLRQREIYWAAIGVSIVAIILPMIWKRPLVARLGGLILGLVFLTGAVVAIYHAGAEWKFWPGPATCSAGGLGNLNSADILDALTQKRHAPSCEDAAWRMAGISMAGYNAVISLVLAGASFFAAATPAPQGDDNV